MGEKSSSMNYNKRFIYIIFAILPIAFFRVYFYPLPSIASSADDSVLINSVSSSSSSSSSAPFSQEEGTAHTDQPLCDYTNGKWVPDKMGPLYNGSTCGTIKEGQNCISHGRPDFGYLYWKWKPNQCDLPRFDPIKFLQLLSNKHLAFVGDSMARNQLESLLCMLAAVSTPNLVYRNGEDNKFRKWHFDSYNVSLSVYWSPFLVKGTEKSIDSGLDHNLLYLDSVDERWAKDLGQIDMVVLSIGHWFLHPAVYMEGDSVLGCHACGTSNHTEIGFFEVFQKAIRTTFRSIIERNRHDNDESRGTIDVILTTFSPSHFEGRPWDSVDACNMTRPYQEKNVEGMDAEMRKIEMEEVETAKDIVENEQGLRIEALDVTGLSVLRPDGHPGPYMYPFPFKNGIPERVHNDCLHWCLPGPVDTWNQIMLEVLKRWRFPERIQR